MEQMAFENQLKHKITHNLSNSHAAFWGNHEKYTRYSLYDRCLTFVSYIFYNYVSKQSII